MCPKPLRDFPYLKASRYRDDAGARTASAANASAYPPEPTRTLFRHARQTPALRVHTAEAHPTTPFLTARMLLRAWRNQNPHTSEEPMTASRAWAVIASFIIGYNLTAKPGQTLSECADGWIIRHPIATRILVAALAAHVANFIPPRVDPIHQLFAHRTTVIALTAAFRAGAWEWEDSTE